MELLDIVDENNNFTGKSKDREMIHKEGLLHREVGVIIINEKNELLLEKRAATKKQSPNKWNFCAGHIESNETPEISMIREMKEEIGISANIEELKFINTYRANRKLNNGQHNNMFIYIFLFKTDKEIKDYKIQIEELSEVKYFSIDEIIKAISEDNKDFAFYDAKYYIDILNKIKEM